MKTKDTSSSTSPTANKGKLQREQKGHALGQNGSWLHQKLRGCEEFNIFHQGWSRHGVLQLGRAVLSGTLGCAEPPVRHRSTGIHALVTSKRCHPTICPVLLQAPTSLPAAGRYCLITHPALCRAPQSSSNKSQSQKKSRACVAPAESSLFLLTLQSLAPFPC